MIVRFFFNVRWNSSFTSPSENGGEHHDRNDGENDQRNNASDYA